MKERYYSLDVFRGATVAFMILVNNQMGSTYAPLDHAPWFGLTPTDLVFPFFLFAVGNALAFVMPRFRRLSRQEVLQKIFSEEEDNEEFPSSMIRPQSLWWFLDSEAAKLIPNSSL